MVGVAGDLETLVDDLREGTAAVAQPLALRKQVVLVGDDLLDLVVEVVLLQDLVLKLELLVLAEPEALVDDVLHVDELFDDVVEVQVRFQLAQVLVDFVEDVAIGLFLCLQLVVGLEALVLVAQVIEEALDELVLDDALVEQVLPDAVELELPGLVGAVDGLLEEDPELLQLLETALELLVVPQDVVEDFLVLHLFVNEPLKLLSRLLLLLPGGVSAFATQVIIVK